MCYCYVTPDGQEIGGSKEDAHIAYQRATAQRKKSEERAARYRIMNPPPIPRGTAAIFERRTDPFTEDSLQREVRTEVNRARIRLDIDGIIHQIHSSQLTNGAIKDTEVQQKDARQIIRQQCEVIRDLVREMGLDSILADICDYYKAYIDPIQLSQGSSPEWVKFHEYLMRRLPRRLRRCIPAALKWRPKWLPLSTELTVDPFDTDHAIDISTWFESINEFN